MYNPIETRNKALISLFILKILDSLSTSFFLWSNPAFIGGEINIFYRIFHDTLPMWAIHILPMIAVLTLVYYTYYKAPYMTEFFTLLLPFVIISNTMLGLTGLGYLPFWVGGSFQAVYAAGFVYYLYRWESQAYRKTEGTVLERIKKTASTFERETQVWETESLEEKES